MKEALVIELGENNTFEYEGKYCISIKSGKFLIVEDGKLYKKNLREAKNLFTKEFAYQLK